MDLKSINIFQITPKHFLIAISCESMFKFFFFNKINFLTLIMLFLELILSVIHLTIVFH